MPNTLTAEELIATVPEADRRERPKGRPALSVPIITVLATTFLVVAIVWGSVGHLQAAEQTEQVALLKAMNVITQEKLARAEVEREAEYERGRREEAEHLSRDLVEMATNLEELILATAAEAGTDIDHFQIQQGYEMLMVLQSLAMEIRDFAPDLPQGVDRERRSAVMRMLEFLYATVPAEDGELLGRIEDLLVQLGARQHERLEAAE